MAPNTFRGCLSGGGDIFSESVANRGSDRRSEQEPCPYGLGGKFPITGRPDTSDGNWNRARPVYEPHALTSCQKTPTGRMKYVFERAAEGHSRRPHHGV